MSIWLFGIMPKCLLEIRLVCHSIAFIGPRLVYNPLSKFYYLSQIGFFESLCSSNPSICQVMLIVSISAVTNLYDLKAILWCKVSVIQKQVNFTLNYKLSSETFEYCIYLVSEV